MKGLIFGFSLVLCTGCALKPTVVRTQLAHYSHLSETRKSEEDGLSVLEVVARWEKGPAFIELGEGVNLKGRNGGGFYGPVEVTSFKLGWEFRP
jgi:hypothetical protein